MGRQDSSVALLGSGMLPRNHHVASELPGAKDLLFMCSAGPRCLKETGLEFGLVKQFTNGRRAGSLGLFFSKIKRR